MRNYKTKAIIIKQYEVGEADRIIVVFSRDLGLLTLKARGVRKILAKLKGHLELYNYSLILAHRGSGVIDTITGAETIHSFKKLRQCLKSTSRIYLIFEFLNRVLPEREEHKKIFDLLLHLLGELESGLDEERRLFICAHFLLRSLKELGFVPHFRECIRCKSVLKKGGNYFDFQGAGAVCRPCGHDNYYLSDKALVGLRVLSENKEKKLPKIKADKKVILEISRLIENYAEHIIESNLKSRQFIKQVD